MVLSVIFASFVLHSGAYEGGNSVDAGGIKTGSNLLFVRVLFRKPATTVRVQALTRVNRSEKQPICRLAQLHWQLYRLYSGQIWRGRFVAFFRIQEFLMFVTPAFAQAAAPSLTPLGPMFDLVVPFIPIFAILYFLIIRPQRAQLKKRADMLAAVRRGDTVVTGGGFVGKVTKVIDDNELEVDLGGGTKVTALRSTIVDVRVKGEPVANQNAKK
jgi:preprotein translocase subunit YajC